MKKKGPSSITMPWRVGWGYDSHRFVKGRPLILGGVKIPYSKGLKGHSDADVVLHAVTDAVIGAAVVGDIGTLFPDSDPAYKGASSLTLLRRVAQFIAPQFVVRHVDVTLLAEEPKVGPYKQRMRAKIAQALDMPVDEVSVKAKTNEGMGFVGKKEGLAAVAVASLERLPPRRRSKRKK